MRWSWLCLVAVVVGACGDTGDRATVAPVGSDASATPQATEGATTDTVTTPPDVDACVLVDASDAAGVLGSPATVDATPAVGFGAASSCAWITESGALLVVTIFEGRMFYGGGDGLPGAEALEVGDQGYIGVEPTFGGVNLQVLKGEWVLSLSAAPFGVVDVEGLPAAMTNVAQQAVGRLP